MSLPYLRIAFHGGQCCGVKTLHGFGDDPECVASLLKEDVFDFEEDSPESRMNSAPDVSGDAVSSSVCMYRMSGLGAPEEKAKNRLHRFLNFLQVFRPCGLVEACLVDPAQEKWFPILEKAGFKKVSWFLNSNSGNYIQVFHLIMDNGSGEQG